MTGSKDNDETYTEAETDARREAALKRMLATPHKPHEKLKSNKHERNRQAKGRGD